MKIEWLKCLMQSRCRLDLINLDNEHFDSLIGVYLIWQGDDKKHVIKVGKGFIRERIAMMQRDKKVYECGPDLFVTWAKVPSDFLNGVEAYLSKELNPVIHENIVSPEVIMVNLP